MEAMNINKYKSFAELKRELKVGDVVTLVECANTLKHAEPHKALNIPRKIIKKQTNAIQFEGGSWLGLGSTGETAANFSFTPDGFVYHDEYMIMRYKVEQEVIG